MNDLRTAAQQALDSINELFTAEQSEGGERSGHIRTPATREHLVRIAQARKALHESCGALRAALAQQAEPLNLADPAVRKRLASQWGYVPAAAQTEPVQEPVGEVLHDWSTEKECIAGTWAHLNVLGKNLPVGTKLYTAPPQRKLVPLSEEEIDHAANNIFTDDPVQWWRKLARSVEKAVWEKNNGQA